MEDKQLKIETKNLICLGEPLKGNFGHTIHILENESTNLNMSKAINYLIDITSSIYNLTSNMNEDLLKIGRIENIDLPEKTKRIMEELVKKDLVEIQTLKEIIEAKKVTSEEKVGPSNIVKTTMFKGARKFQEHVLTINIEKRKRFDDFMAYKEIIEY